MAGTTLRRGELRRLSDPKTFVEELGTEPGEVRALMIGGLVTIELLRAGSRSARVRVTTPKGTETVRVKISEEQAGEGAVSLNPAA